MPVHKQLSGQSVAIGPSEPSCSANFSRRPFAAKPLPQSIGNLRGAAAKTSHIHAGHSDNRSFKARTADSPAARHSAICGPASKSLNGCIRWPEVRLAEMRPTELVRAS